MLVVAERFFCPSLELISEYLGLSPCVAGATLLSFGNGAPDVFTQLAAISQGDGEGSSPGAAAMALSEPLGSGLFVGNVVMALVIFCSGAKEVHVQHRYFLKDVLFYLGGVAAVLGFLVHGVVMLWEVVLLGATYLTFIAVTIAMSRALGDEPLHADPRLHEVPHRLRPMDSFFKESFRFADISVPGSMDLTDADPPLDACDAETPLLPPPPPQRSPTQNNGAALDGGAAAGAAAATPAAALRRSTLASIDEAVAVPDGGGGGGDDPWVNGLGRAVAVYHQPYQPPEPAPYRSADDGVGGGGGGAAWVTASAASPPPTFASVYSRGGDAAYDATTTAAADGGGGGGANGAAGLCCRPGGGFPGGGGLGDDDGGGVGLGLGLSMSTARSQSGRLRELSGRPPGRAQRLWRLAERPLLALLSVFMPRIDNDAHARYRKTYAVLLPPLLPSAVGAVRAALGSGPPPGQLVRCAWWRGASGAGLAVSVLALRFWPRKGHLHGLAAGVATVVVFCEAMALLDGAAGELVSAACALGTIHGISPALLGATLLAWGNSVSDLVSNTTLARDGLPSMAITACFASPMFVLLAGLVSTLSYATRHGDMQLPRDASLRVLYGAATVILAAWALAVPLVFRFRLTRRTAVLAVCAYLAFQAVYITAIVRDARAR